VAFQETPLQTFWPSVLLAVAAVEVFSVFTFKDPFATGEFWSMLDDRDPGNFGFQPVDDEMKTKELNNGRLAMVAIAGMVAQECVTGQKLW
jgi:light-harvesting complex I chlorophyll a/b binding protein 4